MAILDWFRASSQYFINAARAIIAVLVGFRFVQWTPEQIALVITAMESVFAIVTAKTTISHTRVDTIVDKRVQDIVSTPSDVAARSTPDA